MSNTTTVVTIMYYVLAFSKNEIKYVMYLVWTMIFKFNISVGRQCICLSECDTRSQYVALSLILYMNKYKLCTNRNGRVPDSTPASVHTSGSTLIHGYTGSRSDRRSSSSSKSRHRGCSCSDPDIVLNIQIISPHINLRIEGITQLQS